MLCTYGVIQKGCHWDGGEGRGVGGMIGCNVHSVFAHSSEFLVVLGYFNRIQADLDHYRIIIAFATP